MTNLELTSGAAGGAASAAGAGVARGVAREVVSEVEVGAGSNAVPASRPKRPAPSGCFDPRESAAAAFGEDDRRILELVANRYIGANPPVPFAVRSFCTEGVLQNEEGLYDLDLAERLPQAELGHYAYAFALVWSDGERSIDSVIEPLGPTSLYLNQELLYRSGVVDEMKPDARVVVPLLFRKGWNEVLLEARKTPAGFGCRFGADEAKVRILHVLSPFADRTGSAGWAVSPPVPTACFGSNGRFPDGSRPEADSGLEWLPRIRWTGEETKLPNLERIFGRPSQPADAFGWTKLEPLGEASVVLQGSSRGAATVWIDGRPVVRLNESGSFRTAPLPIKGQVDVLVRSSAGADGWGFELKAIAGEAPLLFHCPATVHGYDGEWLYAGPIAPDATLDPSSVCSLSTLFPAEGSPGPSGKTYWRTDAPGSRVRPYYENAMLSNKWTTGAATNYGRWDYPLGVTMYGLLRAASALNRPEWAEYARSHIRSCTGMYDYSLWDRDAYGFPSINQQLVLMKMLDNCGSFGSAMLESLSAPEGNAGAGTGAGKGAHADASSVEYASSADRSARRIADVIAEFMLRKLERREDGAFYRRSPGEYFDDTMWADDLYMSGPFLARYSLLTGSPEAIDESARQFLHYRRYLFMEDWRVMSHVYDFKYGRATRVPWGRGNGWVLFSLTELLEKLPKEHSDRKALLDFFRSLSEGVLTLQGDSGLWRQVLNEPDAYEEASCTAMFAYAFARGVRYGWYLPEEQKRFADAAIRAWRGLASSAIDRHGNVHGVCSGSRYSFSPDYYMHELRTVVNDNHGIGIVILAGIEVHLLKRFFSGEAVGQGGMRNG
ncbi:glycoside hydrolase family 88/105 protein [Cohnella thailandensis]|uniref:Glycoside hydrolase family 88 protein n=1 Tax=Cohnella thailandensis TaxID=557557 RepID=A0A841T5W0_9BACL|nr:glycoside hydrolase family 88 protein [Cohnella thailandensis]MBB6638075.1 glycoside hydrolase family 88 protein [Cohnella thailandensis]MBP1971999.1 rhamnogalacturonyl hydrolase YesR [Cohnella thailandensis]